MMMAVAAVDYNTGMLVIAVASIGLVVLLVVVSNVVVIARHVLQYHFCYSLLHTILFIHFISITVYI
jgi:hypothetical protein